MLEQREEERGMCGVGEGAGPELQSLGRPCEVQDFILNQQADEEGFYAGEPGVQICFCKRSHVKCELKGDSSRLKETG